MDIRNKIINASKLDREEVFIKKWKDDEFDGIVYAYELNAQLGEKYNSSLYRVVNGKPEMVKEDLMTKLICYSICDENGNRIFDEEDMPHIRNLPSKVSDKLYYAANRVNKGDEEENVKN